MSSVSSALTSLASVSTMDFLRHLFPRRGEAFFLRFSKLSTLLWAAALIAVAYASRRVELVLNAAFSLRGLTSGALLGGLGLALFWRKDRALPVVAGMLASVAVLALIETLPQLSATRGWWMRTVGAEIFWPWYTLIGAAATLATAALLRKALPWKGRPER
jgi:Na+/proline symporter